MIYAFDPGGTTGFVMYSTENKRVELSGEILFKDAPLAIEKILKTAKITDTIVYEKFIISPRTLQFSRQPDAMYVIGGIIFLATILGLEGCLKAQTAASAKTAYPSERLKELGLFKQVVGGHARDSLRHALLAAHSTGLK